MEPLKIDYSVITLNNTQYEFGLVLINKNFNINIPYLAVESIQITDNIYNIFQDVTITIINDKNYLDNFTNYRIGYSNQVKEKNSFNFLGSGEDLFILHLKPLINENTEGTNNPLLNLSKFGFNLQLIIDDEDEVLGSDGIAKKRIYTCRDVREYLLDVDKRGYSTVNDPSVRSNKFRDRQLDNAAREAFTGNFIKYVLTESLQPLNPTFSNDWDSGEGKVFYTSPQDFSALDIVEYFLDLHVSAEIRDNCLLKLERDNTFSFRPYSNILKYNRNGDDPGFFIQDIFTYQGEISKKANPTKKDPSLKNAEEQNQTDKPRFSFKNFYSDLSFRFPPLPEFNFLNRTGVDGYSFLISYAVNEYNLVEKVFSIKQEDSYIDAQKDFIQTNYVNKFGGVKPTAIYNNNILKQTNVIFQSNFSLPTGRNNYIKVGRNIALQRYIDSSPVISFDTSGYMHRQSARFMTISNPQTETETAYAELFAGEWLVTQVVHTISNADYTNNITGVKLYFYNKVSASNAEEYSNLSAEQLNKINALMGGI